MKKLLTVLAVIILGLGGMNAKPVSLKTAQKVAENFFKMNSAGNVNSITLAYKGLAQNGAVIYYAFNINNNQGFVIVTGDDAVSPVIGYSNEGNFIVPDKGTTIGNWLAKRNDEINFIQQQNIVADAKTSNEWSNYINYNAANRSGNNSTTATSLAPLVKTKWNQSPYYNAMCPGGSVTGCVATAMAQIMRYWNYPATGNGSSTYNSNYGPLTCDYGTATYNWSNMPLTLSGNNSDVALINYHCGVSVEMDYSPSGSGAWVCSFDNPVCAQNSYVNYFKYDPTTIQGLARDNYSDQDWIDLLKADLDLGRPIQYVGWDPSPSGGGHTWVCDGYDANNFFHMNWGWGGSSNGYFSINSMNPSYNFSAGHEAVTGIVPIASVVTDAAITDVASPVGYYCGSSVFNPTVKLQNFGSDPLVNCTINYKIDNGAVQTLSWAGTMVFGQNSIINLPSFSGTPGFHSVTAWVTNPNNSTDANAANDQSSTSFHVAMPGVLPIVEGFENGSLSPSDWEVIHSTTANNWSVTSGAAATGTKSIMLDNISNLAGSNSVFQTTSSYDLSAFSQPALAFKAAYQMKNSNGTDKLQVLVSTDCGLSWMSKWGRVGTALANVPGTSSNFVPSASDFATYTVNIVGVSLQTRVMFRWSFTADPNAVGNNVYVDDINLFDAAATAVQSVGGVHAGLNVYPNPSNGKVNIELDLASKQTVSVNVTDLIGRTVESIPAKVYAAGENTLTIAEKNYNPGAYIVSINIDGQVITKKVIIN